MSVPQKFSQLIGVRSFLAVTVGFISNATKKIYLAFNNGNGLKRTAPNLDEEAARTNVTHSWI